MHSLNSATRKTSTSSSLTRPPFAARTTFRSTIKQPSLVLQAAIASELNSRIRDGFDGVNPFQARKLEAEAVPAYLVLLREYRQSKQQMLPWLSAFEAKHGRKAFIKDVEETGNAWLVATFKEMQNIKQQLLIEIKNARKKEEDEARNSRHGPRPRFPDATPNAGVKLSRAREYQHHKSRQHSITLSPTISTPTSINTLTGTSAQPDGSLPTASVLASLQPFHLDTRLPAPSSPPLSLLEEPRHASTSVATSAFMSSPSGAAPADIPADASSRVKSAFLTALAYKSKKGGVNEASTAEGAASMHKSKPADPDPQAAVVETARFEVERKSKRTFEDSVQLSCA